MDQCFSLALMLNGKINYRHARKECFCSYSPKLCNLVQTVVGNLPIGILIRTVLVLNQNSQHWKTADGWNLAAGTDPEDPSSSLWFYNMLWGICLTLYGLALTHKAFNTKLHCALLLLKENQSENRRLGEIHLGCVMLLLMLTYSTMLNVE